MGLTFNTGLLSDAIKSDSSLNVGIGTSSPYLIAGKNLTLENSSDVAFTLGIGGTRTGQLYASGAQVRLSAVANVPLLFYTNDTEKMRITASGYVGVGTTNPQDKFVVDGGNNIWTGVLRGTTTTSQSFGMQIFAGTNSSDTAFRILNGATTSTYLMVRGDGNVGIGTSSPNGTLEVYAATPTIISGASASGSLHGLEFRQNNTVDAYIKQLPSTGELRFYVGRNSSWGGNMSFYTDTANRMSILSGGEVRITGAGSSNTAFSIYDGGTRRVFCIPSQYYGYIFAIGVVTNGGKAISFGNDSGEQGSVVVNASSTTYNTTSDYRLKEDFKDFNGLEKISSIKVYDFKWKVDEERTHGVIAHELAEVLPYAVHGEKDGLDRDGKPSYQGVDYSKIVPSLVKAVQELSAKVTALENR